MASSDQGTPCVACKSLRRKCTSDCIFAPYFPHNNPMKFHYVHTVYGATNVSKLLNELQPDQRKEAANSLAYDARARFDDPVYGAVGLVYLLIKRYKTLQHQLSNAKTELSGYVGPQALLPTPPELLQQQLHVRKPMPASTIQQQNERSLMQQRQHASMTQQHNVIPTGASISRGGQLVIREPQQHRDSVSELQRQLAALVERDLLSGFGQQQQQGQHQGSLTGYEQEEQFQQQQEEAGGSGSVTATGFNQMTSAASLGLGGFDLNNPYQIQTQQPDHHSTAFEAQLFLKGQPQQQAQEQQQQDHHSTAFDDQLLLEGQPQQQAQQQQDHHSTLLEAQLLLQGQPQQQVQQQQDHYTSLEQVQQQKDHPTTLLEAQLLLEGQPEEQAQQQQDYYTSLEQAQLQQDYYTSLEAQLFLEDQPEEQAQQLQDHYTSLELAQLQQDYYTLFEAQLLPQGQPEEQAQQQQDHHSTPLEIQFSLQGQPQQQAQQQKRSDILDENTERSHFSMQIQ